MLKGQLIHPTILEVLGSSGHGSKVLIADGNYPFSTGANPAARRVQLNLSPGKLTVTDVLAALITAMPVEAAEVMMPPGEEPAIFAEFRQLLPDLELQAHERFAFYEESKSSNVCMVIATGEQRIYANILLTIGTVLPEA
ncbi:MAG: RbsD/FucU family protein [Anaerolineae bacterium]|nr:RbsD/FucU family protein [Anaerolineae bacterium]